MCKIWGRVGHGTPARGLGKGLQSRLLSLCALSPSGSSASGKCAQERSWKRERLQPSQGGGARGTGNRNR